MHPTREFSIGSVLIGDSQPLFLIAGPCVIESPEHCRFIATELKSITELCNVPLIFKASFDKANRTSHGSFRGPGTEQGLAVLGSIREDLRVPVLTDIHEVEQVKPAAAVVDCLQIPAFLCRQTDLLVAAGKSGCAVNVKKGQFMAPWDMKSVVAKLRGAGCDDVLLCERGTFFGYGRLVNDMRSLPQMRSLGVPVIFDATHSVQEPGGLGAATGGNREMVEPLARAATAIGVDGLFFEVHPDPDNAPSDGPNMLRLDEFPAVLKRVLAIRQTVEGFS